MRALHVSTEANYDVFRARSGLDSSAPLLTSWTGAAALTNGSTPSNALFLQFNSDNGNNGQGVA